jgi:hypothetical protein
MLAKWREKHLPKAENGAEIGAPSFLGRPPAGPARRRRAGARAGRPRIVAAGGATRLPPPAPLPTGGASRAAMRGADLVTFFLLDVVCAQARPPLRPATIPPDPLPLAAPVRHEARVHVAMPEPHQLPGAVRPPVGVGRPAPDARPAPAGDRQPLDLCGGKEEEEGLPPCGFISRGGAGGGGLKKGFTLAVLKRGKRHAPGGCARGGPIAADAG